MTALAANPFRFIRISLTYLILTAGALLLLFPLVWTISTSLKIAEKVTLTTIELIPNPIAWWNYVELFQRHPIPTYFINTMKVLIPALFGGLITCSLAGFAFGRLRFPGRDVIFVIVLSTMMLPYVVRLIPLYIMFDQVGLINTFWPLIIPRILGHDAFYIFLYRQFFRGIPEDLFDAARVDGLSDLGIWARIVLPLSKPVLATVAIFSFQYAWNDFLFPLIYLGAKKINWTMALGIRALNDTNVQNWELVFAAGSMMVAPVLVLFIFAQRYFVQGIALTGFGGR